MQGPIRMQYGRERIPVEGHETGVRKTNHITVVAIAYSVIRTESGVYILSSQQVSLPAHGCLTLSPDHAAYGTAVLHPPTGRAINGYTHLMAFVHPSPTALNRSRCVLMGVHGVMYSAITMARAMLVAINSILLSPWTRV